MRLIKDTNIDFMSQKRLAGMISLILILAGLISIVLQGGLRLSIDFKGGTLIAVTYAQPVNINEVRQALANVTIGGTSYDLSKNEIKHYGSPTDISLRIPATDNQPREFNQHIVDFLYSAFPDKVPENKSEFLLSIDKVGRKIGSELSSKAFLAILSALILILIYISIRFELKFALGAIAALVHDILITLGIFSIMDFEISLFVISAFLTIVGYSLNDTIVVFDRIRENIKALRHENITGIVNRSINESLSRTIITSLTTFFVVFILWLWGGEVIHDFAFAMVVGVIVGTYSSVYIASPIVVLLQQRESKRK